MRPVTRGPARGTGNWDRNRKRIAVTLDAELFDSLAAEAFQRHMCLSPYLEQIIIAATRAGT